MLNWNPQMATMGCSFGGYHAVNFALTASGCVYGMFVDERSVRYDPAFWGYYDDDVYFQTPPHYMKNMSDGGITIGIGGILMCWRQGWTISAGMQMRSLRGFCGRRVFR